MSNPKDFSVTLRVRLLLHIHGIGGSKWREGEVERLFCSVLGKMYKDVADHNYEYRCF